MQIPTLTTYCDTEYMKRVSRCAQCTNDNCENECMKCFTQIHKYDESRDYDCNFLMHHYVCEYIYAYSSEIYHLFQANSELSNLPFFNVLSIGAGPASELFGLFKAASGKNINYIGYDKNDKWTEIHNKIIELSGSVDSCNIDFNIGNVLEDFNASNFSPNVIILCYLVSHLKKADFTVDSFMQSLTSNILSKIEKPFYIVINDTNHYLVRDDFDILINKLQAVENIDLTIYKYHFDGYGYGVKHSTQRLIERIPMDFVSRYQTWQHCKKTAQMVIKVDNKK